MIYFILITAAISYTVRWLIKILSRFYERYQLVEKIPGPPIESWILGHTSLALIKPAEVPTYVYNQYTQYGGIFRRWLIWFPDVTIAEADYAQIFFHEKSLEDKAYFYKFIKPWCGNGLITSNGALWREHRKLITPMFHQNIVDGMFGILVNNSIRLIQKLQEHKNETPVNMYMIMHLVSLDNICATGLGLNLDALNNPKLAYVQAMEEAAYILMVRFTTPSYWLDAIFNLTSFGRTLKANVKTICELTETREAMVNSTDFQVDSARRMVIPVPVYSNVYLTSSKMDSKLTLCEIQRERMISYLGKKNQTFLDLLMEASKLPTAPISEDGVKDEVNSFVMAAHETMATSMSFTLFLLANHLDIQIKCYRELYGIFQGSDRRLTVDDLREMNYLEQVIKESLRLFPSCPLVARRAREDVKFGNYIVPKGIDVTLSIFCLHRDPKNFPDPDIFDPDRFSPENCASRHPYAYVPFGAGSRDCIAQKFAMMEMKIVLSYILRYFILESPISYEDLRIPFESVLQSQQPLDVKLRPRGVPNK